MVGSSSTQHREDRSFWDDLSDFFNPGITAKPTNGNIPPAPRNGNNHPGTIISSANTFNTVQDSHNDYRQFRIRNYQLDNENFASCNRECTLTYDVNYFPKVSKVVLISSIMYDNHSPSRHIPLGETYKCFAIHEYSDEYRKIKKMITNKYILVLSIEEIYNPFLKRNYQLKKKQKEQQFPLIEEMQFFHGTKMENIDNICKNNLNWRRCGTGTGHRFGQGVSFSCNAMYAAHYSQDNSEKVMILVNVLIGQKCVGNINMKLSPDGYDTSLKNATDHVVVVKYEDNEFYPAYKIKFRIAPGYSPQNKGQNINRTRRARVRNYSSDFEDYSFYFD